MIFKNIKRLIYIAMTAVSLLGVTGLYGCSSLSGCVKEEVQMETEKEEMVLWCYWDTPSHQKALDRLVKGFNESREDISVQVKYIPDEDFKKELVLAMADGRAPDVAIVDSSDFQFLYDAQPFADLTDEIEGLQDYLEVSLKPCTVGGRIYGMPFGLNCTALFYNEDMFKEAQIDVPETWEDFRKAARALTDEYRYGFGMAAVKSEESVYCFLPVLWSMGGHVTDIDSRDSSRAFSFISQLTQEGVLSRESINMTLGDVKNQFTGGKIAMMINTTAIIGSMERSNPELNFGVTFVPSDGEHVAAAGGEILAVTEGEHRQEAIEFLQYLNDGERMASYIDELGVMSCRKDIIDGQFKDDPLQKKGVELLKTARTREITPEWPRISLVLSEAMEDVIVGERVQAQVLGEASRKIAEIREEGQ